MPHPRTARLTALYGLFFSLAVFGAFAGRCHAQTAPGPNPAGATPGLASWNFETIRDIVYKRNGDESLLADIYEPLGKGPFAGVLLVHGGAWISGNKTQLDGIAKFLAAQHYAVVAINYRLAPKYKFPAQIEDCRDALQWMRDHAAEYKIDAKHLAGWGYSAGGHLVTLLGLTTPGLAAIVAGGAPCDFREMPLDNPYLSSWLGDTRRKKPEAYDAASPAKFVSADAPPVFFYHGETDHLVPLAQPKALAAELTKAGVHAEMYTVAKAGHVGGLSDREAVLRGKKFLDQYLRNGKAD
jgi:acetyl esterase/lipase